MRYARVIALLFVLCACGDDDDDKAKSADPTGNGAKPANGTTDRGSAGAKLERPNDPVSRPPKSGRVPDELRPPR